MKEQRSDEGPEPSQLFPESCAGPELMTDAGMNEKRDRNSNPDWMIAWTARPRR